MCTSSRVISLDNVKRGVVAITTNLNDIQIDINEGRVIVIDSTYRTATNDYIDNKYQPSGIVLLGIISMDKRYNGIMEWTSIHHDSMKKHKHSIITTEGTHHGSSGNYYSYGNKANFGMVDLSSIAQYTVNKSKHLTGICLEEISQMEIQLGIDELKTYIPILPKLISPFLSTANHLQNVIGDINIKKTSASEDGIWQTCMCVNTETQQFHTEMDCAYTLIHVPNQHKLNTQRIHYFSFQLSNEMNISFDLKAGTSLMFSGQCITHRKLCNTSHKDSNDVFINFASYGNARLYRHIRNSFLRVEESKNKV